MSNSRYPTARTKDLVIQTLNDETLVYDVSLHQAHCLNETAAFVWSKCTGDASIDNIAGSVREKFGQTVDADFVRLAVAQLDARKLMIEDDFAGPPMPSRRELIRKLGVASALAIPLIASIVTPADSYGALSCRISCIGNGDCVAIPVCGNFCSANGVCAPGPPVSITW